MDAASLRAEFEVCEHAAYLNAGTCGPIPRSSLAAFERIAEHFAAEGRAHGYYESYFEERAKLRTAYAALLGADEADVAITSSTSEGIGRVLAGLGLQRGDEILIAEREHPGLIGPVIAARELLGATVREVPLDAIADSLDAKTRLIACSHVAWTSGEIVGSLAGVPDDVPVLLDGAQGVGAIPIDLAGLGCAFYAGSGQKWLCGPVGTGMLWVSPAWRERLAALAPTYINLEDTSAGLGARVWADARAHDAGSMPVESVAAALAAHDVLAEVGWNNVHARARTLAGDLATALTDAGREVLPRGDSTLVTWRSDDAESEAARLRDAGVVVRNFPGLPFVRASVGAWNDASDLERLLAAAG